MVLSKGSGFCYYGTYGLHVPGSRVAESFLRRGILPESRRRLETCFSLLAELFYIDYSAKRP